MVINISEKICRGWIAEKINEICGYDRLRRIFPMTLQSKQTRKETLPSIIANWYIAIELSLKIIGRMLQESDRLITFR